MRKYRKRSVNGKCMFFLSLLCPYHTFKGLNKVEANRKEKKTSFPEKKRIKKERKSSSEHQSFLKKLYKSWSSFNCLASLVSLHHICELTQWSIGSFFVGNQQHLCGIIWVFYNDCTTRWKSGQLTNPSQLPAEQPQSQTQRM